MGFAVVADGGSVVGLVGFAAAVFVAEVVLVAAVDVGSAGFAVVGRVVGADVTGAVTVGCVTTVDGGAVGRAELSAPSVAVSVAVGSVVTSGVVVSESEAVVLIVATDEDTAGAGVSSGAVTAVPQAVNSAVRHTAANTAVIRFIIRTSIHHDRFNPFYYSIFCRKSNINRKTATLCTAQGGGLWV